MNIKSLLLGSAAALAVVSGAQAADAIVAAEPEPMEYVRVCDAFGTGYFYIPGTETCLKISGYVRAQVDFRADDYNIDPATGLGLDAGYRTNTRGYLEISAMSDSEIGAIEGYIALESDSRANPNGNTFLDTAIIKVAGFTVGYMYNYWDAGINGETDSLDGDTFGAGAATLNDAIQYTYKNDAFSVSGTVESFNNASGYKTNGDDIGISGQIVAAFGPASLDFIASYDAGLEEAAFRGIVSADLGPGKLQVAGVYSTGASRYWDDSEWSVAASYAAKLTDKLSLTPGVQYWDSIGYNFATEDYDSGNDAWKAGLTLDYKIAEGLTTKISAQYIDVDNGAEGFGGFFRLQRSF